MKWCVFWLSHLPYCGTQSRKTVIIKMSFYERFQPRENELRWGTRSLRSFSLVSTDDWRNHSVKLIYILLNKSMHSIYYFADINECDTGKYQCDSHAFCNNTKGSYNCTCKPGYFGNGFNCTGNIVAKTLIAKALTLNENIFTHQLFSSRR